MIAAVIAGGVTGVATFMVTGVGLVATPAPGSIFAYLTMTPRGAHFGVLLGIVLSAGVSFLVGALLLGFGKASGDRPEDGGEPAAQPEPVAGGETAAGHTTADRDAARTDVRRS